VLKQCINGRIMKYVFISFNYSPVFTSPESWFQRTEGYLGILENLAKENEVINVKQIDYEGSRKHNGVKHLFLTFGKKKSYFPIRLNAYVKQLQPDIVFVQGLHHPLQVIQLRLMLNSKTKIIAQHHAEKPWLGIKRHIQRLADKCIDAYLFASNNIGNDWVKNGNISATEKIHEVMEVSSVFYPINKAAAKSKTDVSGNTTFLWVGRLNANKDPLNVVEAFLKFSETNPDAQLYMIYHTEELLTNVQQLISGHPNKTAIKLIGKVPHDELLYWFNSADFFLSGSHYEGSGTAVCEAMSCGCIPIVTDIFSFRMITDNGDCGLLYKAGDRDDLLNALTQTGRMDVTDKKTKALTYFKSNLSFDAIAREVHKIASSL
jgi:glycosyltransferase involved in cell wall biosynthesis